MKLFLVALLAVAATADRLENTYLPPSSSKTAGGSGQFLNAPRPGGGRLGGGAGGHSGAGPSGPSGPVGPAAAPIGIIRLNNDNNGDGTYSFDFETENRITAQETGGLKNAGGEEVNNVQGSFSYTAPDGATYSINYVADENGFQPQGEHLPTSPPIPEDILKALEQNAADEAAGIVDDGQYRPAEHEGAGAGAGYAGAGSGSAGAFSAGTGAGFGGAAPNKQYLAPKPSSSGQQGYKY